MIMSGVRDGTLLSLSDETGDGVWEKGEWIIRIGRKQDNDISLIDDDFSSGHHARLHKIGGDWWLEDTGSTNGTFVEVGIEEVKLAKDSRVALERGQLFRVGKTWLRIQPPEDAGS
jgi:pSer/pThr/pTyr-binding forkhead associated (FHA) protein